MDYSNKKFKKNALASSLAVVLSLSFASAVSAQDAASATDEKKEESSEVKKKLDTVQVVGSRISRSEIEGPSPVTIISREELEKQGFDTVADALSALTQNTSNSFTGELAVTGFTPNQQVINLRNLGPGYTLVLVNGRRLADYPQPYNRDNSSVNVGAIPSSIIERVEILSGGASAIYGSDAVAGVVNIITRKNVEDNVLQVTAGTTAMGGGDRLDLVLSGGATGEDWNFVYALQAMNEDPIFASQRSFMDDVRDGPLGANVSPGLDLAAWSPVTGFTHFFPGNDVCNDFNYETFNSPTRGLVCGSYTDSASRSISNKRENNSGYFYADKQLANGMNLWASLSLYKSKATASAGTEFWGSSGDPFLTRKSGALTPYYYQQATTVNGSSFSGLTQLQRVFQPFEVGGNDAVVTKFDERTYDFAFGLSGQLTDRFDFEASASTARYEYAQDRPRLLAKAVHDKFLTPVLDGSGNQIWVTSGGAVTSAGTGYALMNLNVNAFLTPLADGEYESISTRVVNEGHTTAKQFGFMVTGDLMNLPAGPLGFASNLEWAEQTLNLESDPRTNPLRPVDASTPYNLRSSGRVVGDRSRVAFGTELSIPVLDSLRVQLAGRYDKYDDITEVDDALTYNLGVEWRPTDKLLLRAAYATSFRAPDMPLVFAEGAAGFTGAVDLYACRANNVPAANCGLSGSVYAYTMQNATSGNPELKEEEGESFTAGFVYDFGNNASISVDYYRIDLSDAASVQSLGSILSAEAGCRLGTYSNGDPYPNASDSAFCQQIYSLVVRDEPLAGDANFGTVGRVNLVKTGAINTAFSSNSGIDATFRYSHDTDSFGTFAFNFGYTLVMTEKYKQFDSDPLIDYRDSLAVSGQRSRFNSQVSWNHNDWSATVFGTRYGSAANWTGTGRLQPWMVYNATVGYRWSEKLSTVLTVQNIFNNTIRTDETNTTYPYYDPFIGQDPRGRAYSARVVYKF